MEEFSPYEHNQTGDFQENIVIYTPPLAAGVWSLTAYILVLAPVLPSVTLVNY